MKTALSPEDREQVLLAVVEAVLEAYREYHKVPGRREPAITATVLAEGIFGLPEAFKYLGKHRQALALHNALETAVRQGLLISSTGYGPGGREARLYEPAPDVKGNPATGTCYREWEYSDLVDPRRLVPVNEVRHPRSVERLIKAFLDVGWMGPPILAVDQGNGWQALTGSHRIAAAREIEMKVPVYYVDSELLEKFNEHSDRSILEAIDDDERLEMLREIGDPYALEIMKAEDANWNWHLEENPFEQPEPPDDQYDPVELAKGIEVELEHTQDRRIAKRIAKDHLDETKSYYRKLATLGLNPPGGRITLASVNVAIAYTRYALEPATMRVRVELGRPPPMAYYLWPVDAHDETIPDMRGEGMELCIGRLSDIPLEQWPQEVEDRIAGHPLKTQRIGEYRRSDFGIDPVTGRRML